MLVLPGGISATSWYYKIWKSRNALHVGPTVLVRREQLQSVISGPGGRSRLGAGQTLGKPVMFVVIRQTRRVW